MQVTNAIELQHAIDELKFVNTELEIKMKAQVKDLIEDATESIAVISIVLGGAAVVKKIFSFKKDNFFKGVASYGVERAVATAAINNADKIKAFATAVWKNIFKKN